MFVQCTCRLCANFSEDMHEGNTYQLEVLINHLSEQNYWDTDKNSFDRYLPSSIEVG